MPITHTLPPIAPPTVWQFIKPFLLQDKARLLGILVLSFLRKGISNLIWPYYLKWLALIFMFAAADQANLFHYMWPIFVFGVTGWLLQDLTSYGGERLKVKTLDTMRRRQWRLIIRYLLRHSQTYFNNRFAGALVTRLEDITTKSYDLIGDGIEIITSIICMLIFTILFGHMHIAFVVLLATWFVVQIGWRWATRHTVGRASRS